MTNISPETASELPGSDMERRFKRVLRAQANGALHCDGRELLQRAGLRPTRQRLALGSLLLAKGNCHVTAEILYEEAISAGIPVSLATVYNTLNQLTDAGLLRRIGVDGSKSFFDTNCSEHQHFYLEGEGALLDVPASEASLDRVPSVPDGFEIARVEVIVRLRRKAARSSA